MSRRSIGRTLAQAAALSALLVLPAASQAGLHGSPHDFSALPIGRGGSCAACHVPHAVQGPVIWGRSLADEAAYFTQAANPDYLPAPTLQCFDCHDDGVSVPDQSPSAASWVAGEEPEDIAFSLTPADATRWGTTVGYYELIDGTLPGTGNPAPVDGSPTGGHFWRSEPTGTPDAKRGDKISCRLCHDPHGTRSAGNEVFFVRSTADGAGGTVTLGTGLRASGNTRTGTGDGRAMCASCHGYADAGAPVTLWGVALPRPPGSVGHHLAASAAACTGCHQHNKIVTSCRECHGYPPLVSGAPGGWFDRALRPDTESYAGGAGAHRRHRDALGDAIFACDICHGPNPGSAGWHGQGGAAVLQQNVDLIGKKSFWDPGGTRAAGYDGEVGAANPDPSLWEFTARAKSGGDQRCFGLACHGDPPNAPGALNWTDRMVDDATGAFVGDGGRVCAWCHDATPAPMVVSGGATSVLAPNVMGDGVDFGAEVNGHGVATTARYDRGAVGDGLGRPGAGKACTVCHDATYQVNAAPPPANVPRKAHFDGVYDSAEKRLRGTINAQAVSGADAVCAACHQHAGVEAGTQVSHHGNAAAGGYTPLEPAFSRVCRQCHEPHGRNWNGAGRNLYQVGRSLDLDHDGLSDPGEEARVDSNATEATAAVTAADNAVVFVSRVGADSFDAGDGTPANNVCVTCHAPATGGGGGTGGGDHAGATGYTRDERGNDCTQCHTHDYDQAPGSADGFMPSTCIGCHNGNPTYPLAPNVVNGTIPGSDGLSYSWYGTEADRQDGGHGDPQGRDAARVKPACTDCHDLSLPAPGTHLNGIHDSVWNNSTRNGNTAHLKGEFFTKYPASQAGPWSVQVAFDNYCLLQCHVAAAVPEMTHNVDSSPSDPDYRAVEFGTHGTVADGDALLTGKPYPIDEDLNTAAAGPPSFATCVTCHDPHGTTLAQTLRSSNRMVRDSWVVPPTLCVACHQ